MLAGVRCKMQDVMFAVICIHGYDTTGSKGEKAQFCHYKQLSFRSANYELIGKLMSCLRCCLSWSCNDLDTVLSIRCFSIIPNRPFFVTSPRQCPYRDQKKNSRSWGIANSTVIQSKLNESAVPILLQQI